MLTSPFFKSVMLRRFMSNGGTITLSTLNLLPLAWPDARREKGVSTAFGDVSTWRALWLSRMRHALLGLTGTAPSSSTDECLACQPERRT